MIGERPTPTRFALDFVAFDGRDPADGQRIHRVHAAAYAGPATPSRTPS
jgi:hypothetical protein